MERNSEVLHFGDEICLRSEVQSGSDQLEGYLNCDGYGNNDLTFLPTADGGVPNHAHSCVFRVTPTQSYASKTMLAKLQQKSHTGIGNKGSGGARDGGGADLNLHSELGRLHRGIETERRINQEVVEQANGLPVKYGQGVQLLHVDSGKYVTLMPSKVAATEKQMMKCELDVGDEGSLFAALPRYKIYELGETVHCGDSLVLTSTTWMGSVLRPGKKHTVRTYRPVGSTAPSHLHEVNAAAGTSTEGATVAWNIQVYRRQSTLDRRTHAFGGAHIFLYNAEVDACATMALRSRNSYVSTFNAASTAASLKGKHDIRARTVQSGNKSGAAGPGDGKAAQRGGRPSPLSNSASSLGVGVVGSSSASTSQSVSPTSPFNNPAHGGGGPTSTSVASTGGQAGSGSSGGSTNSPWTRRQSNATAMDQLGSRGRRSSSLLPSSAAAAVHAASLEFTPKVSSVTDHLLAEQEQEDFKGAGMGWSAAVSSQIKRGTELGLRIADDLAKGMLLTDDAKQQAEATEALILTAAVKAAQSSTKMAGHTTAWTKIMPEKDNATERFIEVHQVISSQDRITGQAGGSGYNSWTRSNALFQIEMDDGLDGGPCRWDNAYRLRHVSTGMFLCIHPESFSNIEAWQVRQANYETAQERERRGSQAGPGDEGAKSDLPGALLAGKPPPLPVTWLSMSADRGPHTLFDLVPTKRTTSSTLVTFLDCFAIRMHGVPLYIHMDRLSGSFAGVSSSPLPDDENADEGGGDHDGEALKKEGRDVNKTVVACLSVAPAASDEDGSFSFQPANKSQVQDMLLTISHATVIDNFIGNMHRAEDVTVNERDALINSLAELVHTTLRGVSVEYCREAMMEQQLVGGGNISIANQGIQHPPGQTLLRDQFFVEKLYGLLRKLCALMKECQEASLAMPSFKSSTEPAASQQLLVRKSRRKKAAMLSVQEVKGMIVCTYNLIECLVKGNKEISTFVAKQNGLLDQIIQHLGGGFGSGPTLQSLLTNNRALLQNRKLVSELPARFMKLITKAPSPDFTKMVSAEYSGTPSPGWAAAKQKQARFLQFADSLCTCDGDGVRENQDLVCAELFPKQPVSPTSNNKGHAAAAPGSSQIPGAAPKYVSRSAAFLDVYVERSAKYAADPLTTAKLCYPPLVEAMRRVDRTGLKPLSSSLSSAGQGLKKLDDHVEVYFSDFVELASQLAKSKPKSAQDQLNAAMVKAPEHAELIIQLLDYFVASLHLISSICLGGNTRSIDAVHYYFSTTVRDAFRFRWTQYGSPRGWMPPSMMAALCEVTTHCYINTGDLVRNELPSFTRSWPVRDREQSTLPSRKKSYSTIKKEVLCGDFLTKVRPSTKAKSNLEQRAIQNQPDPAEAHAALKRFILHYLTELAEHWGARQVATDTEQNRLTLTILTLCNFLMRYGKYDASEIPDIVIQLKMLLDPTSDRYDQSAGTATAPMIGGTTSSAAASTHFGRLCTEDAHTQQLYRAKFQACSILESIMDIRLDFDITEIMNGKASSKGDWNQLFKQVGITSSALDIGSNFDQGLFGGESLVHRRFDPSVQRRVENASSTTSISSTKSHNVTTACPKKQSKSQLVEILISLGQFPHPQLQKISLSLLFRHFSQHETLVTALSKVVLLDRNEDLDLRHNSLVESNLGLKRLLKTIGTKWIDVNINKRANDVLMQMDCHANFDTDGAISKAELEKRSNLTAQIRHSLKHVPKGLTKNTEEQIQANCKHYKETQMLCSACCVRFLSTSLEPRNGAAAIPGAHISSMEASQSITEEHAEGDRVQQRLHKIAGIHKSVGELLIKFQRCQEDLNTQLSLSKLSTHALAAVTEVTQQSQAQLFASRLRGRMGSITVGPDGPKGLFKKPNVQEPDADHLQFPAVYLVTVDRMIGEISDLLAMFCADNGENQNSMQPLLRPLILCMHHSSSTTVERLCKCVTEMLRNNRPLLLSRVNFDFLSQLMDVMHMNQQNHGFLPTAPLGLFQALLQDSSGNHALEPVNIKPNQDLVLRVLLDPMYSFVLSAFENVEVEYEANLSRMQENLCTRQFHQSLLQLMMACCAGHNYTCEAKCQSLLPLPLLMRIIKSSNGSGKSTWERDIHMKFLNECYLDTEYHAAYKRGYGMIEVFWGERLDYDLSEYEDGGVGSGGRRTVHHVDFLTQLQRTTSEDCYCHDLLALLQMEAMISNGEDPENPIDREQADQVVDILEVFLPAMDSFFRWYVTPPSQAEHGGNVSAIMRERNCAHQTMLIISKVLPVSCVPSADSDKFVVTEMLNNVFSLLIDIYDMPAQAMVIDQGQGVAGFFAEVQKTVKDYRRKQQSNRNHPKDKSGISVGRYIAPEQQWQYELQAMNEKTQQFSNKEFDSLITNFSQLRDAKSMSGTDKTRFSDLITTLIQQVLNDRYATTSDNTFMTLTVLEELIVREPESKIQPDVDWQESVQSEMAELGGVQLVIHLLSFVDKRNLALLKRVFNLAIALLGDGNKRVQMLFLDHFNTYKDEKLFHQLHGLMRRLSMQLNKNSQLSSHLDSDEEKLAIELPTLLFRFLQLLCENHNVHLQECLQQQKNRRSFDLVTESCQFLLDVEPHVDQENARVVQQLLDALTEYTQGPCSGNQEALHRAKLPRCINRFLRNFRLSHEQDWNPDLDPDYCRTILCIKVAMINTLLSVLEGRPDDELCARIAAAMDFEELETCIVDSYSALIRATDIGSGGDNPFFYLATTAVFKSQHHNPMQSLGLSCSTAHLSLGYATITLLQTFVDSLPQYAAKAFPKAPWLLQPGLSAPQKQSDEDESAFLRSSFFFFSRQMASCEIIWGDLLTKIHFPVHRSLLEHISNSKKRAVISNAMQLETPQERINAACNDFFDIFEQVDHEVKIKQTLPGFSLLTDNKKNLGRLTLFLTLALNVMLLCDDKSENENNGVYGNEVDGRKQPAPSVPVFHWMIGLASVKVLVTVVLLIIYVVMELPVLVNRRVGQHREQVKQLAFEKQAKEAKQREVQFSDVPYDLDGQPI